MKKNKIVQTVLGLVLVSMPLFAATTIVKTSRNDKDTSAGYTKDATELNRIVDVINIIENNFVGKEATPSKNDLYEGAVAGVVSRLKDPYSEYLSKADLNDFSEDMDGEYVGVGMTISKKKGEPLEVVSPFIGSPAEKVGIKIKDKITKVDGKDILPLTANETVKLLKGKEGTKVDVEVVREGKKDPMKFTLTRAKIKLEMVESKMLENNIGYVSLLKFGNHVGAEVEKAIKDLQAKSEAQYGPGNYIPDVPGIFWTFRIMVAAGSIMLLVAFIGLVLNAKGKLVENKTFLKIIFWMLPLPYIAQSTGWFVAEAGRQPWLVYGLQLTANGASKSVTAPEIMTTIIGFTVIYILAAIAALYLAVEHIKKGPDGQTIYHVEEKEEARLWN